MSIIDNLESELWVERYAPRKVSECILPARIKSFLQSFVDSGVIKSYTAIGSAGCGKTSSAKALLHEMGVDYLFINASETGNIETIRTKVREYATKMSLGNDYDYKVILLDEADGLSLAAQNSLRGVIEEFQDTCRFILTANYGNKVPDALKSRCPVVEFSFASKQEKLEMIKVFFARVEEILKENKVSYDRKELLQFCDKNFPDFRKTLNLLSRFNINNQLELKNVGSANDDKIAEVLGYLKEGEWTKMRKWVAESMDTEPALVRRALYDKMYDVVKGEDIPSLVLLLNEYDFKEASVVDKEINSVAMFTEIMNEIGFK